MTYFVEKEKNGYGGTELEPEELLGTKFMLNKHEGGGGWKGRDLGWKGEWKRGEREGKKKTMKRGRSFQEKILLQLIFVKI